MFWQESESGDMYHDTIYCVTMVRTIYWDFLTKYYCHRYTLN